MSYESEKNVHVLEIEEFPKQKIDFFTK